MESATPAATDLQIERTGETLSAALDDGRVILDINAGLYFSFNAVGGRVWELLSQPRRLTELSRTVTQEFEVPVETAARDVKLFIDELQQRGLVRLEVL